MGKLNHSFRRATIDDFDIVKSLWKECKSEFGVPYTKSIVTLIEKRNLHLLFVNDDFVGMCGWRDKSIICLGVFAKYRGLGYGTRILKKTVALMINNNRLLPIVAVYSNALDGADNNKFYDKFGEVVDYIDYKTCRTRIYEILVDSLL